LNESSAVANRPALQIPPASWKWIGLIGGLGFLVICLNAGLFLLVQQHERGIATREDDVRRRLVEVTAKEAQLGGIKIEIASLEAARTTAQRRKDDAEKAASDAEQLQAERNRLFADKRTAESDLSKLTAELEGQKRQIEALKSENAAANKTATTRSEEIKALETRRDALTADIEKLEARKLAADREAESARKEASDAAKLKAGRDDTYRELQELSADVARLRPLVESLKASQSNIAVNEAAAKKADELRTAAESALAKAQDELQSVQQRLVQLKADLSQYEQLRTTQAVDKDAVQRATSAREEAEVSLAKTRDELASEEKRLAATRTALAGLEQRRQQIAIDEKAAKRAEENRSEAEKNLVMLQEQIDDLRQRRDNTSAKLDDLRRRLDDETRRLQELCATSNPPTPPALGDPVPQSRGSALGPPSSGPRPTPGPTRLVPRQPANPAPRASSQP
jgi:chromosome segregation ATPase